MAKNVMNLDQVARGMMPNNHTLLSDEDPMEGTSQQPHNWTRFDFSFHGFENSRALIPYDEGKLLFQA